MREHHLISKVFVEPSEYVQKQLIEGIHNFVIVVVDLHFQVQTGVLGEMPMGVRIFGAEDRANFVHPPHITRNAHLFSQLRTLDTNGEYFGNLTEEVRPNLSEISRPTEIVHLEHSGAGLGSGRLKFRRLYFCDRGQQSVAYCRNSVPPHL